MTAVEFLSEQLLNLDVEFDSILINRASYWIKRNSIIEQAKEIEKETLHQVWKASEQNMRSQFSSSAYKNITFEDHYEDIRSKKY